MATPGSVVGTNALITPGGAQGPAGTTGPGGPNAWTNTSASFTVPALGASVTVNVGNAAWMVVGEMVWIDQAGGGVGKGAALQVTATTPTSVTLLNTGGGAGVVVPSTRLINTTAPLAGGGDLSVDRTLSIPPASASTAGILNQLSGNTTDYVRGDNTCQNLAAAAQPGLLFLTAATNLTTANNSRYVICSGGSWTLGLPTPAVGLSFRIRNDMGITGTTGTITIQPASGTIDGAASLALLAAQEVTVITDGTNWRTFGRQRELVIGTQDLSSATQGLILLPPGYRSYRFLFENLVPATLAAYLVGQISADGGNTWRTANYYSSLIYNSSATAVAVASNTNATVFYFTNQLGNPAGNTSGTCDAIFWPGDGTRGAHMLLNAGGFYGGQNYNNDYIGHQLDNGSPIIIANAIKYYMNTGNISLSQLTVKGVV